MLGFTRPFFILFTLINIGLLSNNAYAFIIQVDETETLTVNEDSSTSHSIFKSVSTSYKYLNHTQPFKGSLTYNSSSKYLTYKPPTNYCGSASYTYSLNKYVSSGGGGGRPRDLNSIKEPISPNSIESATSSISENSSEGTITNISKVSTTLGTTHYITLLG